MFYRFQSQSNNNSTKLNSLAEVSNEDKFSLPYLRKLHQTLVENKVVTSQNMDLVIEILYTIAEISVYGDNKSELLFDFFCEKNMLSLFLELMWEPTQTGNTCPVKVHIQILQTLSILINSVKNNTSLYYLLSNNYINEIIVFPHNFDVDESLRDQFVSFMKTLSLRLNAQTVQFFFVEETGAFPLLSRAVDFLHFSEAMVRIASQTTILNILQVCDSRARRYALQDELIYKFLSEVVLILTNHYQTTCKICYDYTKLYNETFSNRITDELDYDAILTVKSTRQTSAQQILNKYEYALDNMISTFEDWIYFLQDLMGLNIDKLHKSTINYILSQYVYPTLLLPLQQLKHCNLKSPKSNLEDRRRLDNSLASLNLVDDLRIETSSINTEISEDTVAKLAIDSPVRNININNSRADDMDILMNSTFAAIASMNSDNDNLTSRTANSAANTLAAVSSISSSLSNVSKSMYTGVSNVQTFANPTESSAVTQDSFESSEESDIGSQLNSSNDNRNEMKLASLDRNSVKIASGIARLSSDINNDAIIDNIYKVNLQSRLNSHMYSISVVNNDAELSSVLSEKIKSSAGVSLHVLSQVFTIFHKNN